MKHRRSVIQVVSGILLLLVLLWVSYVGLQIERAGRLVDTPHGNAIVVLGADQEQGWPSPAFRARLDQALSLYEEGIAPLVVVAGGNPEGRSYTESAVGVSYLEYFGLPSDVLLAAGGDNTYQNLQEVQALAKREGWENVVLVSEPFHMFRSLTMAQDLGLRAYGSPASASPAERNPIWHLYFVLREVAASTAYILGVRNPTPL